MKSRIARTDGWAAKLSGLWRGVLRSLVTAGLGLVLAACGGGDGGSTPAADSASALIGAAGGRVATAQGAEVVVPAGALATMTTIAIARTDVGAPALPAGFMAAGEMFAFTPHGTAFAAPVTISLPVDAARFPAGLTPTFYKTNAAGSWERVSGATLSGGRLVAQVSGFSFFLAGVPPQITQQPQDATVAGGSTATFSVTALGLPPFFYAWQSSTDAGVTWDDIGGAMARTYTTAATVAGDDGKRFRVLVSNPDAQATSQAAILTVTAPIVAPVITTQPAGASIGVGTSATFTVAASGSSLMYRWQISRDAGVRFDDVPGATGSSVTHVNAQLADNGAIYRVIVSNLAGSLTSTNALLAVTAAPPPPPVGTWQQLGGALDILAANQTDHPAVALDPAGNPVVAWAEYGQIASGAIGIRVARWDGGNWVALGGDLAVFMDPNLRSFESPSIAIDPTTGQPLVAWSESRNGLGAGFNLDVIVKRWNGTAWERLGTVLNVAAGEGGRSPKVRVTSAGTPIVAWFETPHFTHAKRWDGSAWVAIGGQNAVGPQLTGAQDGASTALTIDANGDPIVMHGAATGLLAARGTSAGWSYLGPRVNATGATSTSWGAAVDGAGRPLALIANAFDVRARRFESGAWADLGGPLLTLNLNRAYGAELAVPFATPTALASWYVLTTVGPTTTVAHSFRLWDGFAWQPIAADLPHYCQIAVRTAAFIAAGSAPVAACVRGVGAGQDIVVYRLMP